MAIGRAERGREERGRAESGREQRDVEQRGVEREEEDCGWKKTVAVVAPGHWPLAATEDFLVCGLIGLVPGAVVFGRDKTHTKRPPPCGRSSPLPLSCVNP